MSQGLRELTDPEWNAALETVLLPRLAGVLETRAAGHCMRVTDLDRELMVRLCGGLRARVPGATVVDVTASYDLYNTKIEVQWTDDAGETSYGIWRYTSDVGASATFVGSAAANATNMNIHMRFMSTPPPAELLQPRPDADRNHCRLRKYSDLY